MLNPLRGDIWLVTLDPVIGHEQAKKRPCLVLSNNTFNNSSAGLIVIIPLTSKKRNIPLHIPVYTPEGGLTSNSFLMCEQIRSVSVERFSMNMGKVSNNTLHSVEYALRVLLDFE